MTTTVGSKIIRVLEIIHVKSSDLMQLYEININQVMTFRLYTAYTVGKKSIRALEIFRVQKLILNTTS